MLRLRPYKKCDAQYIVTWIKDEFAFRQWCADRYEKYPINAEDVNAHYEALAYADNFFAMTAFDESGAAGHMIMRFLDEEKRVLRFGFIIVDANKRGKGYGKEMLLLAERYAFEILKVEKITLGVFQNNPAAYHCYQAAGFRAAAAEPIKHYRILDADWACMEMELLR